MTYRVIKTLIIHKIFATTTPRDFVPTTPREGDTSTHFVPVAQKNTRDGDLACMQEDYRKTLCKTRLLQIFIGKQWFLEVKNQIPLLSFDQSSTRGHCPHLSHDNRAPQIPNPQSPSCRATCVFGEVERRRNHVWVSESCYFTTNPNSYEIKQPLEDWKERLVPERSPPQRPKPIPGQLPPAQGRANSSFRTICFKAWICLKVWLKSWRLQDRKMLFMSRSPQEFRFQYSAQNFSCSNTVKSERVQQMINICKCSLTVQWTHFEICKILAGLQWHIYLHLEHDFKAGIVSLRWRKRHLFL